MNYPCKSVSLSSIFPLRCNTTIVSTQQRFLFVSLSFLMRILPLLLSERMSLQYSRLHIVLLLSHRVVVEHRHVTSLIMPILHEAPKTNSVDETCLLWIVKYVTRFKRNISRRKRPQREEACNKNQNSFNKMKRSGEQQMEAKGQSFL